MTESTGIGIGLGTIRTAQTRGDDRILLIRMEVRNIILTGRVLESLMIGRVLGNIQISRVGCQHVSVVENVVIRQTYILKEGK